MHSKIVQQSFAVDGKIYITIQICKITSQLTFLMWLEESHQNNRNFLSLIHTWSASFQTNRSPIHSWSCQNWLQSWSSPIQSCPCSSLQDWTGLQFFWKLAYQDWIGLRQILLFECDFLAISKILVLIRFYRVDKFWKCRKASRPSILSHDAKAMIRMVTLQCW